MQQQQLDGRQVVRRGGENGEGSGILLAFAPGRAGRVGESRALPCAVGWWGEAERGRGVLKGVPVKLRRVGYAAMSMMIGALSPRRLPGFHMTGSSAGKAGEAGPGAHRNPCPCTGRVGRV